MTYLLVVLKANKSFILRSL